MAIAAPDTAISSNLQLKAWSSCRWVEKLPNRSNAARTISKACTDTDIRGAEGA